MLSTIRASLIYANDLQYGSVDTMDLKHLLTTAHIRVTPKRLTLLSALSRTRQPSSAEMLHARVGEMDLVTIYRNLQEFRKAGIVREVRFKDGIARYELSHSHHHHLVCTACGLIEELDVCEGTLEKKALQHSRCFEAISEHALEFFGLCKKCA